MRFEVSFSAALLFSIFLASIITIFSQISIVFHSNNSIVVNLVLDSFCSFVLVALLMGFIDSLIERLVDFFSLRTKLYINGMIAKTFAERLESIRSTSIITPSMEKLMRSLGDTKEASTEPASTQQPSTEPLSTEQPSTEQPSTESEASKDDEAASSQCSVPDLSEEKKQPDDCSDAVSGASTI